MNEVILFYSETAEIKISMKLYFNENDQLFFDGYDSGKLLSELMGSSNYEYTHTVEPEELSKLYELFKLKKDDRTALLLALQKRFSGNKAYSLFADFLRENNIEFKSFCWR